jgi:iron(II)-dependent oxidoreductase
MKNVIAMAGLLVLVAAVQADISWGQTGFGAGQSMDPNAALKEAQASEAPAAGAPRIILAGHVVENDPSVIQPGVPVEWVSITGRKFVMGTDGDQSFYDSRPIHEVAIKDFEMSKTLVTVEQYAECVIKGGCTEPGAYDDCNWGKAGRQRHPINCVDWDQAKQYAKFKGAKLPSEAEYEYAATSGGKNQKYPWGNDDATSDRAVISNNGTMPVCSKPAGNTAQGLCDMAGNVFEWVEDAYRSSYDGAPKDGGAVETAKPWWDSLRVRRGGSYYYNDPRDLRADTRSSALATIRTSDIGFRLARSSR